MSPLIIALDFSNAFEAEQWLERLDSKECAIKIGSELFTQAGAHFVQSVIARGFRVFLDLKFHDIPNTVAKACRVAADLGVWMMNVHALGGQAMMTAARNAIDAYQNRPLLIAVTLLTSHTVDDLKPIGLTGTIDSAVVRLAQLALDSGLDGVVSSAFEVPLIKATCGASLAITPGIRLLGDAVDDQARIMTPDKALSMGSDYLVIGRSITGAQNPSQVISHLNQMTAS